MEFSLKTRCSLIFNELFLSGISQCHAWLQLVSFFHLVCRKLFPDYAVKLLNINEPKNKSQAANPQAVVQVCLDTLFS